MPWFKSIQPAILGFQILILCFVAILVANIHNKKGPVANRSHSLLKITLQVSGYSVFDLSYSLCFYYFAFIKVCVFMNWCNTASDVFFFTQNITCCLAGHAGKLYVT